MKHLLLILAMTFWFSAYSQNLEIVEEKTAVENALRDYIEGWYQGNAKRMDRSLHDDLVKRISVTDSSEIGIKLRMVPKSRMVELTENGGGENPNGEYQIIVDHIDKDIATARVLSEKYHDYCHLAKTNDGWQIVNILFRYR
ncbi:MAG TPA: nuclear transport factor 2 family protein [Flavobacteriaceae bacterium]|nr:nuclear transport factor 2 family protein [Flavobacteriaceae bacterium]